MAINKVRREVMKCAKNERMDDLFENADPIVGYLDYLEDTFRKGKSITPLYPEIREMLVSNWQQATARPVDEPHAKSIAANSIKREPKSVVSKRKDDKSVLSRLPRKGKNG